MCSGHRFCVICTDFGCLCHRLPIHYQSNLYVGCWLSQSYRQTYIGPQTKKKYSQMGLPVKLLRDDHFKTIPKQVPHSIQYWHYHYHRKTNPGDCLWDLCLTYHSKKQEIVQTFEKMQSNPQRKYLIELTVVSVAINLGKSGSTYSPVNSVNLNLLQLYQSYYHPKNSWSCLMIIDLSVKSVSNNIQLFLFM